MIGSNSTRPKTCPCLIGEAAELLEHFQWLTEDQSQTLPPDKLAEVELELADIQLYLIRLADKLNIDLLAAADKKIVLNEKHTRLSEEVVGSKNDKLLWLEPARLALPLDQ